MTENSRDKKAGIELNQQKNQNSDKKSAKNGGDRSITDNGKNREDGRKRKRHPTSDSEVCCQDFMSSFFMYTVFRFIDVIALPVV